MQGTLNGGHKQLAANCSNKVFKSPARAIALRQFSLQSGTNQFNRRVQHNFILFN
jgi:hypothetical protein